MAVSFLPESESRMKRALEAMRQDLATLRTGRASPALVENVAVDYYGTSTPLKQVATISSPEARLLVIQPWDPQSLGAIERGLLRADLGLTPTNDGAVVRLAIPPLTEERRRELARQVGRKVEEGRVEVRSIRRNQVDQLRAQERAKEMSQDALHRGLDQLQRLTDSYINEIDKVARDKEAEVMEV